MIARRPARGFSLFELAVAAIIVGLLTVWLLSRLQTYQLEAERVAADRLVGTLRTALSIRIAQLSVAKREHELQAIIDENPITWLVAPPKNYLGEYYSPEQDALPHDAWYFDRGAKELVYKPSERKSFGSEKQTLLRFNVKFPYLPVTQGKTPGLPRLQQAPVLDQVSEQTVVNK
ncbi:MAG TPA: prepilin-type N-terminal cleavage/methylation domain-containing protein [Telluria sp.]